jgi:magnesium transporter
MENQEELITNLTTDSFIRFLPETPADEVIGAYRELGRESDVHDYVYVVDRDEQLKGVVNLPEILMANQGTPLSEIMTTQVISIDTTDSIGEAREKFARYGFSALPVADAAGVIHGVVLNRDIMELEHKFM